MPFMPTLETDNYYGAFHFRVSIAGLSDVNQTFTKVTNIISESEPMEFNHGTDPYTRKSVGRTRFDDVALERVYNGSDEFYEWRLEIENGTLTRRDITIELLKQDGTPVRTMVCRSAWPIKWQLPDMDASGSNPAAETITLSVERVTNS